MNSVISAVQTHLYKLLTKQPVTIVMMMRNLAKKNRY